MPDTVTPPEAVRPAKLQYGLGTLFGVIWFVSCVLAGINYGAAVTIATGIPLGFSGLWMIIGYCSTSGHERRSNFSTLERGAVPIAICLTLGAATLLFVTPADSSTWITLFGGAAWTLALLPLLRGRKYLLLAVPLGFQVLLLTYCFSPRTVEQFVPLDGTNIQDVRGGRMGISMLGCRFITSQYNARLLEEYLGPVEAQWKHASYLSPRVRDGNERVQIVTLARYDHLRDVLNMLPDRSAREQVLRCIVDPNNKLRVHQGLLLVSLYNLGFPPGYDADHWWQKHGQLFRQVNDAKQAAQTAWGWRSRIQEAAPGHEGQHPIDRNLTITRQCRAAENQEKGSWGGDREFGAAYELLRELIAASPHGADDYPELEFHSIAWWPQAAAASPAK